MQNIMESVIKWQTGVPKEGGNYLITTSNNNVLVATYSYEYRDGDWYWLDEYGSLIEDVLAWCHLSEIEPYKE